MHRAEPHEQSRHVHVTHEREHRGEERPDHDQPGELGSVEAGEQADGLGRLVREHSACEAMVGGEPDRSLPSRTAEATAGPKGRASATAAVMMPSLKNVSCLVMGGLDRSRAPGWGAADGVRPRRAGWPQPDRGSSEPARKYRVATSPRSTLSAPLNKGRHADRASASAAKGAVRRCIPRRKGLGPFRTPRARGMQPVPAEKLSRIPSGTPGQWTNAQRIRSRMPSSSSRLP